MTKKEMIEKIIIDLNFRDNKKVTENCIKKNTLKRVQKVYNYFLKYGEPLFCITLLNK